MTLRGFLLSIMSRNKSRQSNVERMLRFVAHPEVKEELKRLYQRKANDTRFQTQNAQKPESEHRDSDRPKNERDREESKDNRNVMKRFVDQEETEGRLQIKVHESELRDIFEFLQIDPHSESGIDRIRLRQKLEPLFGSHGLTEYDVECMMLQQDTLSYTKLMELLMDNDIGDDESHFNPIESAMHSMFDRRKSGHINPNQLMEMFENMGFSTITKSDIISVMKQCDDNDNGALSIAGLYNNDPSFLLLSHLLTECQRAYGYRMLQNDISI